MAPDILLHVYSMLDSMLISNYYYNVYMKTLKKIAILFCATCMLSACDSYLDKQEDEAMTFDKIWMKRATTEKYLNNVWGFMPRSDDWEDGIAWIGASDEASLIFARDFRKINFGTWSPADVPYSSKLWPQFYQGIREATVFIQNVDRVTAEDVLPDEKEQWKAEARFARAYYYFLLLRTYGPVILLDEELVDFNQSTENLYRQRNTYEECATYIEKELLECVKVLPLEQETVFYGKPTQGACLALIGRLKLYNARPLFNGNKLYANVLNAEGKPIFPTSYDANKWKEAADANKKVIDLKLYSLYKDPSGDPAKSYQGVFIANWNEELIFARYMTGYDLRVLLTPSVVGGTAYGGIGPTQQQVDAYAMANGKYPIKGYASDGSPVIDATSGYTEDGFSDFAHPIDQVKGASKKKNTFNMYVNREPRFYVSVLWSGADWVYTAGNKEPVFAFNGNSGPGPRHDYPKSGYMCRKFIDPAQNSNGGQWGTLTLPEIRLAEVYLNYVEALNECEPANPDVLIYLNKVRERAGVPDIEVVYPEAKNNQTLMRELIRKERRVELSFESIRYFDTRTWMIAEQTDGGVMVGMNIMAPVTDGPNKTPAAFWKRTELEVRVFEPKHYLFPMHQKEMERNKKLTQNYGW